MRLDKSEGAVKDKDILGSAEHRFAREVEDQGSGNLTLNHFSGGTKSFHHPSIRPKHRP